LQDEAWLALEKKHRGIERVLQLCRDGPRAAAARHIDSGNTAAVIDCCQIVSRYTVSTFGAWRFATTWRSATCTARSWRRCMRCCTALTKPALPISSGAAAVPVDGKANAAKWPLVSCFLAYSDPQQHVCIKPTVKGWPHGWTSTLLAAVAQLRHLLPGAGDGAAAVPRARHARWRRGRKHHCPGDHVLRGGLRRRPRGTRFQQQ
jgi:hypothetical protein